MQFIPVYDKYSFTMQRSKLILYSIIGFILFAFSFGVGTFVAVDMTMGSIMRDATENRIMIQSLKKQELENRLETALLRERCRMFQIAGEK